MVLQHWYKISGSVDLIGWLLLYLVDWRLMVEKSAIETGGSRVVELQ